MINQGQVITAAAGGRPNNQPMALIGGVQGSQALPFSSITQYAKEALDLQYSVADESSAPTSQAQKTLQPLTLDSPMRYDTNFPPSLNFLDSIAQSDDSSTPLQFAAGITANCRFYYTPTDIQNITNTWDRVAKGIKLGGNGLCMNETLYRSTSTNSTAHGSGNETVQASFVGRGSMTGRVQIAWTMLAAAIGVFASISL